MTLKELKQELIDFGRTCIPEAHKDLIRIPGTSESDYMYLKNTDKKETKELVKSIFGRDSISTQIANNSDLPEIQNLKSFQFGKEDNSKDFVEIFPNENSNAFIDAEKNRVENNINVALNSSKTSVYQFINSPQLKQSRSTFSWVPFFSELSTKLTAFENKQDELLTILRSLGIETNMDYAGNGKKVQLSNIDPFTFYGLLTKHSPKRIIKFSSGLKSSLKVQAADFTDVNGLPSTSALKAWYFPYSNEREEGTIELLWKLFKDVTIDKYDNNTLKKVLKIKSIGHAKLTQGFFYLNPNKYFPINSQTFPLLQEKGINPKFETWEDYLSIITQVKEKFKMETYQVSYFAFQNKNSIRQDSNHSSDMKGPSINQILYGPPGTGKTYNSINRALSIIENQPIEALELEERKDLLERYQDYHAKGQIVFTTFHQSLSYEDFIEGLKPAETEGQVTYGIEDGIFKSICEKAKTLKAEESGFNWSNRSFFKMSLGGKNNPQVHSWCLENGVIALGWGGENDLSEFEGIKTWVEHRDRYNKLYPEVSQESSFHCQAARKLLKMKIGDVVVASMGNHIIDAIGIVDGPYQYDEANEFGFLHTRKVKWIVKGINTSPKRFFRKGISQQAIYEFYDKDVIIEAFEQLTEEGKQSTKPHVLIIDEINRGNVSAIFGELITLLEEDKRIGNVEELMVTLPYSKSSFGVPNNVYVLGTMNTADRSVEALDVALRRRFTFEYKGPRYDLEELQLLIEEIDITGADLLKIINERISYIKDEDHQIGHSYFMNIRSAEDWADTFNKNIIPLLQEYFYNDYSKIRLILGDGFVKKDDSMPKMAVTDEEGFLASTRYKLLEISSENILEKLKLTLGE